MTKKGNKSRNSGGNRQANRTPDTRQNATPLGHQAPVTLDAKTDAAKAQSGQPPEVVRTQMPAYQGMVSSDELSSDDNEEEDEMAPMLKIFDTLDEEGTSGEAKVIAAVKGLSRLLEESPQLCWKSGPLMEKIWETAVSSDLGTEENSNDVSGTQHVVGNCFEAKEIGEPPVWAVNMRDVVVRRLNDREFLAYWGRRWEMCHTSTHGGARHDLFLSFTSELLGGCGGPFDKAYEEYSIANYGPWYLECGAKEERSFGTMFNSIWKAVSRLVVCVMLMLVFDWYTSGPAGGSEVDSQY